MRCKYSKNGKSCRAYATLGSKYCFWHNPDMKVRREEARRKGGMNRRKPQQSQNVLQDINKVQDIQKILVSAVRDVLAQENSMYRARTIGYLCKILLKVQANIKMEKENDEFTDMIENLLT